MGRRDAGRDSQIYYNFYHIYMAHLSKIYCKVIEWEGVGRDKKVLDMLLHKYSQKNWDVQRDNQHFCSLEKIDMLWLKVVDMDYYLR